MPLWGFGSFKRKISFYLVGVPINLAYENSVPRSRHTRVLLSGEKLTGIVPGSVPSSCRDRRGDPNIRHRADKTDYNMYFNSRNQMISRT